MRVATQVIIKAQWLLLMICVCDVMSTKCVFSEIGQQARVLHYTQVHIPHYAMIVMPGLIKILYTGIGKQWMRNKFNKVFLLKLDLKYVKNVWRAVINDNNFAPFISWSLCECVSDFMWTSVFFWYLGPKQSPPISHNDLKKDGA